MRVLSMVWCSSHNFEATTKYLARKEVTSQDKEVSLLACQVRQLILHLDLSISDYTCDFRGNIGQKEIFRLKYEF